MSDIKTIKLLLVFVFLLTVSCKKESTKNLPKTRTELLVNKKWVTVAASARMADGSMINDGFSDLPAYKKDDYYIFKADLTFNLFANIQKGPGQTAEILETGNWKLVNADAYLELKASSQPPGSTITYFPTKILAITGNSMKWEVYDDEGNILWITFSTIN